MAKLIRWLHLSDFHIGKDEFAQQRLFTEILSHITDQKNSGFCPDLVFLTGDIANRGKRSEYEEFRDIFYTPLAKLLPTAKIYAVPGNHDVLRPSPDALNPRALLASGSRFFDPTREGSTARGQVTPRFKAYKQQMSLDVSGDWIVGNAGTFTQKLDFAGSSIGIVGTNTAWLAIGVHDKGQLTAGYNLVETALKSVSDCDVLIVLGHHPLDWFSEDEAERFRAAYGRYGVIYLHGHMHKTDGKREEGAGFDFLAFQAGAGFQARDDEIWRNGLVWGEIDTGVGVLRLAPRFWNPKNLDWPPEGGRFPENRRIGDSNWWAWSLPKSSRTATSVAGTANQVIWQAPSGWIALTNESLALHAKTISSHDAANFFDGAEPDWTIAQCTEIPRRAIVSRVLEQVLNVVHREHPHVHLLIGPSGEGKSLALRQIAVDLVAHLNRVRVLWHQDETAPLTGDQILALPKEPHGWVVISDYADLCIRQLHASIVATGRAGRSDVQFLFASRESDWRASGAQRLTWRPYVSFKQETLSGLSEPDAMAIARAWLHFDPKSSRWADGTTDVELGRRLITASNDGAEVGEGALLGGVLAVRFAEGLLEHVRDLLERLSTVALPGGSTLLKAFSYVAAMHAEGLTFLSRVVLAQLTACPSADFHQSIVFPLGREAAAGGGTLLLTRHRKIAVAAITVLREDLGEDVDLLYVDLARGAKAAFQLGYVPELHRWDYALPDHFLNRSPDLALRIAHTLLEADPQNSKLAVSLARLYRESGAASEGASVLSSFSYQVNNNRGFWFEWAACAGEMHNYSLNAWLASWALADHQHFPPPDNNTAVKVLSGICVAFSKLFVERDDLALGRACDGSALLGLMLSTDRAKFLGYLDRSVSSPKPGTVGGAQCIGWIGTGLLAAWPLCSERETLLDRVATPAEMQFDGLLQLISARSAG